ESLKDYSVLCGGASFFFFLQAEDGIRDFHVTGVQTCALPISAARELLRMVMPRERNARSIANAASASSCGITRSRLETRVTGTRSEERRVGREELSLWWCYLFQTIAIQSIGSTLMQYPLQRAT